MPGLYQAGLISFFLGIKCLHRTARSQTLVTMREMGSMTGLTMLIGLISSQRTW